MEPEVFISYNHMAGGAGLWSKVIGTAQIVLGVRWPLADSQETISPLVGVSHHFPVELLKLVLDLLNSSCLTTNTLTLTYLKVHSW